MQDITAQINGGQLGGLLQFRTQVLDASMARLDVIADTLATAINDQHSQGRDLNGDPGGDFFTLGGAENIQLNLTDARQIAAASGTLPFNASDNGNALALAELQRDKTPFGGTTVQGAYAQIVADVGSRTRTAELNATAQQGLLAQAEEAHSAVSGVNLDEEAAKLMHYQQAYQAAAQVIAVAQTLFETVIAAMRR
jgi:flagellar hook-associated protein 1 FlgK